MPTEHINPSGVSKPANYSHVVEAKGSRIIFVSGQVATDKDGNVVGKGDLARQAEQVYENLKTCLAARGATFADVTKFTTFIVNFNAATDRPVINEIRQRYLPSENPPASTLVGVQ